MTLKTTNISSPRHIIEPPLFLESLKPLFNGRVCAESFSLAESPGANGRKLAASYSYSYDGPRLLSADYAEDCTLSIATDFSEKVRRDGEYAYDPDGRLSRDSNKGVTISYNILGLPSLVCDGVNRIRRTYDSQGTLLRTEYGTERIEFTSPEPGQAGAIVATPVFDLARVSDRCGPVEYADHTVERYIHEAGWIDSHGRHVAAVRDCRGSLRATWTAHSALPPPPDNGNSNNTNSNNTNGNPSASGNNGSSLTLPGQGIGQVLPAGNVYADLTAYYPFGLPFADWQGASRDLFSGKELERSGNLLDYDFHARRLDPQLLIFDKPDPLAATYPHLNPYLYCAANPVSLTDPSGRLVSAPESRHLSGFIDDMVYAVGLGEEEDKYRNLFKINKSKNQICPIEESILESLISELKPSEDQEILMRYTIYAINNKQFNIYIDYTPNNEIVPNKSARIIEKTSGIPHIEYMQYGGTQSYLAETIRALGNGAVTFSKGNVSWSSINPNTLGNNGNFDIQRRAMHSVHEILGHSVGFALGLTFNLGKAPNNMQAIRIENCYNRIHNIPMTDGSDHENIGIGNPFEKPMALPIIK